MSTAKEKYRRSVEHYRRTIEAVQTIARTCRDLFLSQKPKDVAYPTRIDYNHGKAVSQPQSRLLSLPPEIRNIIYNYAVVSNENINVKILTGKHTTMTGRLDKYPSLLRRAHLRDLKRSDWFSIPREPGITAACRQTRQESLDMYYLGNDWLIHMHYNYTSDLLYYFPPIDRFFSALSAALHEPVFLRLSSPANDEFYRWDRHERCLEDVYNYRKQFPWLRNLFFAWNSPSIQTLHDFYQIAGIQDEDENPPPTSWEHDRLPRLRAVREASYFRDTSPWTKGWEPVTTDYRREMADYDPISSAFFRNIANEFRITHFRMFRKFLQAGHHIVQTRPGVVTLVSASGWTQVVAVQTLMAPRMRRIVPHEALRKFCGVYGKGRWGMSSYTHLLVTYSSDIYDG